MSTDPARWSRIDHYFEESLALQDPELERALERGRAAGLPDHDVAPNQGRFLSLLAATVRPRSILEIGTLAGYSTIWLARTLPDGGRLISLEIDPAHAAVARENVARAGLADRVAINVGPAADSLDRLVADDAGPFDFVFIDADKESNVAYFDFALRLTRPGSLIVVDNVVRDGAVTDERSTDPRVQGVRALFAAVARESRVSATAIQTVGVKGHDGFLLARVVSG